MPMWTIYHTPDVFDSADKAELSGQITDIYTAVGLPRFYVVVVFNEIASDNLFIGGERSKSAVRVSIDHIARRLPDAESRARTSAKIAQVLAAALSRHRNVHWEFHVDETSEQLWMINGLTPPPARSDAEKHWAETNSAQPY